MLHHRAGVAYANLVRQGTSIQASFAFPSKYFLGFFARNIRQPLCLTVGENHRIDSLAATDAVPIGRTNLEHFLLNHQPAATMAAIGLPPLSDDD